MPRPQLVICPHTHMDIIKAGELRHYYENGIPDDWSNEISTDEQNKTQILRTTVGVMENLVKIYNVLENNTNNNVSKKLAEWKEVKEELVSENTLTRLAGNEDYFTKSLWTNKPLLCKLRGMACSIPDAYGLDFIISSSYQSCIRFDMLLNGVMDDTTSQGMYNGLSLVLMAENTLIAAAFNSSRYHIIPGMTEIMSLDSAMKGVSLGIYAVGREMENRVDIQPGVSARLGITAKKIHRLKAPYTNCLSTNQEETLLMQDIRETLGNNTPKQRSALIEEAYSQFSCR